ncbi:hypothetical protein OIU85_030171 [Salix viminalis]|uniref:Uncharacterized protein n=1 Tax=Salix viminalis TaxID=40686 RepID=A0A9Q0T7L7_SALVM|nr:hypothetical protein OIU85_030171 [Salix viminalis]
MFSHASFTSVSHEKQQSFFSISHVQQPSNVHSLSSVHKSFVFLVPTDRLQSQQKENQPDQLQHHRQGFSSSSSALILSAQTADSTVSSGSSCFQ